MRQAEPDCYCAHTAAVSGDDKDFLLAGRNMGVITLAPTIALTVLGSAHITGVFEMSYGMGAMIKQNVRTVCLHFQSPILLPLE